MTRVLVVEDNGDLAFGVVSALEAEGYEVALADSGPTALERAAAFAPDLIILDLMLPGFDGFRVLRTLRDGGAATPVLILTARGEEEDKLRGFRLGADDYVTKPFGAMELLARVAAVLRRTQPPRPPRPLWRCTRASRAAHGGSGPRQAPAAASLTSTVERQIARFGDVEVNFDTHVVRRSGQPVALTPKEYDLLVALISRRGAVARRDELLDEVWGYRPDVSTRTIDIHVSELRRKLERDPSSPRHVVTVWKVGYRFET